MKILHVIISKGFAGSELYLINLLNYQSKKHDTYLIKNINKENRRYKKHLNPRTKVFDVTGLFKKIKVNKIIDTIKPDIVHTHLGLSSRIIKKKNFKLVSTLHMNYENKYYQNHDGLIISNKTQEKKARKNFRGKIKRSLLWACTKKNNNFKSINVRKKLGIPHDAYIFGSVGRFHKQKGFDIILNSFLKSNLSNAYLILLGNGHNDFNYYKSKNIKLLGHQDNTSDYYKIFNCYISASRWETFGISLIEAMKFNLPIITTVHEGNIEWINNYSVTKFNIDDTDSLKSKIEFFYRTKPKKRKYNLNRFNYENICKDISKFYIDI